LEDEDEIEGLVEEKVRLLKDWSEEEVEVWGDREVHIVRRKMFPFSLVCLW
jgi:hypothetical protein